MNDQQIAAQQPSVILDPSGRPARRAKDATCPKCGAGRDRRVLSAGFGAPHDVCGECGHDFEERTL
jgi:uncharacterized protein (DUF983 family)